MYAQGCSINTIRKTLEVPRAAVRSELVSRRIWLRQATRKTPLTTAIVEKIILDYREIPKVGPLVKRYRIGRKQIQGILTSHHIKLASRGDSCRTYRLDERAFNRITQMSAYWVGFLMADGCITTEGGKVKTVSLALARRDASHLLKFKDFLKSNHPIVDGLSSGFGGRHAISRFSVCSVQLIANLQPLGLTPRKTFTAKAPANLALNRHFWRGLVDGDGTLYLAGKTLPVIGLSGTRQIAEQFLTFAKLYAPWIRAKPRRDKGIWQISFAGYSAMTITKLLYGRATVSLDRKQDRARQLMDWQGSGPRYLKAI